MEVSQYVGANDLVRPIEQIKDHSLALQTTNENQIQLLGAKIQDIRQFLTQTCYETNQSHRNRIEYLKNYVSILKTHLQEIIDNMVKWRELGFWERIFQGKTLKEALIQHNQRIDILLDHLKDKFSPNSDPSTFIDTPTRQNSLARPPSRAASLSPSLRDAVEADEKDFAEHLFSTARTIGQVGPALDMSYISAPNLMEDQAQVIEALKTLRMGGDASIAQAQAALIQAIEMRGNQPLYSIDPGELTVPTEMPTHRGSFSNIYKGIRNGEAVAIKQLSFETERVEAVEKRIRRESKIWQNLQHRNVVPFIGVCRPPNIVPTIISKWMVNDNARKYFAKHDVLKTRDHRHVEPDVTQTFLDIAEGLLYLHGRAPPIVHGGLKASNILIDADGTARITDFALSSIESDLQTGSRPPPMRWSAPEVLDGDELTSAADMHSFACVIIEIITDQDPFPEFTHMFQLHRKIRDGLRPSFPKSDKAWRRGLTNPQCKLWILMQKCWAARPEARPSTAQARDELWAIFTERRASAAR